MAFKMLGQLFILTHGIKHNQGKVMKKVDLQKGYAIGWVENHFFWKSQNG